MNWILREDDEALCLDGYPIRIVRKIGAACPFALISDWHGSAEPYVRLQDAKAGANRLVEEIDSFTHTDTPEDKQKAGK